MTTQIFISAILGLTLASCNNDSVRDKPKQETPKALEEKSSSYEIVSKRNYDDLVESLYNELLSKDTELKKLDEKIDKLNKNKTGATELFDNFNRKNQTYFSSADIHISEIKDSLLRNKIKNLLSVQLIKYNSKIARHNELLEVIETKKMAISDLYNALKVVKTLPLIDKYEKDNLPSTKSFEDYIIQHDEIIRLADTLLKK